MLSIAKAHMSSSTQHGVVLSEALATDVSWVSILQAGEWVRVSTPTRHYFSTYPSTTDWCKDSVQLAILGLSE